ncbi:MAG: 4-(cytidine 5'-diphospho)-2-C-methyl-D-erythritol kinase [Treponema sp.]|jgi:4-diphosphocytidyl-2-C-methyl-D-erythritol kinase|nr:4-(cytidine 5'-diphospho)-2-C-methyl-D-erythritol kinase [Treponema sp.]
MACIKVAAPCKINLHLSVGERRADGYHNLESLFQALDFGDSLDLEFLEERDRCDIRVNSRLPGPGFQLPPEENIVYKAVSLFRRRTGFDRGLRITLEKRVPPGGGLGGGSSDAAAVLGALDTLAGTDLGPAELRDLALALGSDVPFFLAGPPGAEGNSRVFCGGAAWVSGRGERIVPLAGPRPRPVVLVNPGFPSPTGEAFRRLDKWRARAGAGRRAVSGPLSGAGNGAGTESAALPGAEALIRALDAEPGDWPYRNDFLPVFCEGTGEEAARYRRIISALRNGGAGFAGLSGAGSTCFGVFNEGGSAKKTAQLLSAQGFLVYVTFFLARSPFRVLKC